MINPKRVRAQKNGEQRKKVGRPEARRKRRLSAKVRVEWRTRAQIGSNADKCIHRGIMVGRQLKTAKNPGVVALARKGVIAERGLRIACEEMGVNLPRPHVLKILGPLPVPEGKGKEVAIEKNASALAQHIRTLPMYSKLKNCDKIFLVDDVTVGGGQVDSMEKALQLTFPKAEVHVEVLFSVNNHAEVPKEIKLSQDEGRMEKYPGGYVYVGNVNLREINSNVAFRWWQVELRKEIREQLKDKKYVI